MNRSHRNLMFVLLAFGALTSVANACPSCQEALAQDGGKYVDALFWSILFMLAMPFTILGVFGFAMYRATHPKKPAPLAAATEIKANEREEELASV